MKTPPRKIQANSFNPAACGRYPNNMDTIPTKKAYGACKKTYFLNYKTDMIKRKIPSTLNLGNDMVPHITSTSQ
jgi:hypothetical protein